MTLILGHHKTSIMNFFALAKINCIQVSFIYSGSQLYFYLIKSKFSIQTPFLRWHNTNIDIHMEPHNHFPRILCDARLISTTIEHVRRPYNQTQPLENSSKLEYHSMKPHYSIFRTHRVNVGRVHRTKIDIFNLVGYTLYTLSVNLIALFKLLVMKCRIRKVWWTTKIKNKK